MKSYIYGFVALFVLVTQTQAAINVNVTYTGDNIIGAFYQDGSSPISIIPPVINNWNNWQVADTATLSLPLYDTFQLIFEVQNDNINYPNGNGNPAAFLAQISGVGVHGQLLTSVQWEYAIDTGTVPGDFDSLSWIAATSYGNNGGSNIWTSVHGGPITGISTSAQWIWAEYNYADLADPNLAYNKLWIRGVIDTIPEPTTLIIWSLFCGLGIIFAKWQRRRKTA
jgi:hypothetical protein